MKNSFSLLFQKMIKISQASDNILQNGCSESVITSLQERVATELTTFLPEEYITFLRQMNGYSDLGIMLYAAGVIHEKKTGSWIYGIIETNKMYFQLYPQAIVLGESGDDLFIYDNTSKYYKTIDRVARNIHGEFALFWDMLDDSIQYLTHDE